MSGPFGTGKSMLAKRIPSIIPNMTKGNAIETTKIHSITGTPDTRKKAAACGCMHLLPAVTDGKFFWPTRARIDNESQILAGGVEPPGFFHYLHEFLRIRRLISLGSGVSFQQFPDPQITSKKLELGLHLALPDKRAVSFVILSLPA
jgi:hypothetical protein